MNGGRRVLVVDDEESLRVLVSDLLESEGFEVRTAYDGDDGLRVLQEWRPDVILLDLLMPGIDTQTFRRDQQAVANVPASLRRRRGTRRAGSGARLRSRCRSSPTASG
jgi:CheY-like chemotaxis protein